MITVQSLIKVANMLVPVDELIGPIENEEYINGAIELSIGRVHLLTRDHVDLVVRLWAAWIEGLEEASMGRAFTTSYPDLFLEIALRPQGDQVVVQVDDMARLVAESVPLAAFRTAMVAAARRFFERLRPLVTLRRARLDGYLARLAALDSLP
jgi:hypothetical protein